MWRTVFVQKVALQKEEAAILQKPIGWFSDNKQDVKSSTDLIKRELTQIDKEFEAAAGMLRSLVGSDQTVRIHLPQKYSQNSNSGGTLTAAGTMDPSTTSEFSTLALIFNEYRLNGGSYKWLCTNHQHNTLNALNSLLAPIGIVAYSPVVTGTVSSVAQVMQQQQHQIFAFPVVMENPSNPMTELSVGVSKIHEFDFHVPRGTVIGNGVTSDWQTTLAGSTFLPYGYLVVFADGFQVGTNSIRAMDGYLTYEVDFRIRI